MSNSNIKDFQKEVLSELATIKNREKWESLVLEDSSAKLANERGCLWALFFRGLDKISAKAWQDYEQKRNFIKWEKEAERLLAVIAIREALCSTLQDFAKREILNDERLVNLVVETLEDDAYQKTFAIQSEPILFAFICHKLSEIGIEKFCSEKI